MTYNIKYLPLLLVGLMSFAALFNACKKDDDTDETLIVLNSFGPSPVLRGGELRFIGKNLDQVTAVVLADNVNVTSFKTKTSELLTIDVPEATVNGIVTLKTPQGDIKTKTILTISEPISITSFSPAKARPGETVTINGTYLNLIKEVVFANKKSVLQAAFVSQSSTKLEVKVPDDAQTGIIAISNGLADPIIVESETELDVTLPSVTGLAPTPVKAGTQLTISGTDLDLTKEVIFTGGSKVTSFTSINGDKIELNVPADAKDGALKLVVASLREVITTQTVEMKVPSISGIAPNPAKNGSDITLTGTDLDLVTKVTFGGNKDGQLIAGGSSTSISVKVPADASVGTITVTTAAGKTVTSSGALDLVKPSFTTISPLAVQFNNNITVTGTDLDLVAKVTFTGGTESAVSGGSATEFTVAVPVGTQTGPVTLVMLNGDQVVSTDQITILPSTSATITNMPTSARPGDMINIEGVNLSEITTVIFPGNVLATMFGQKTDVLIQVVIPQTVQTGMGTITLVTATSEIITSPVINIQGVDPVADPALVFFDFDALGLWWGDTGGPENDPALSLDGTNYFRANKDCNGWTGFFWRNGQNGFPGPTIGTDVNNYVMKFDINTIEPITGGEFAWRLKGSAGDFWYRWKPWEGPGTYTSGGWVTITIPVNQFSDGTNFITDLSTITEDFGVAFNAGASKVNVCIDNVRFEHL